MHHMLGVLALVPVAMLLTVSFFVLFARQKTEDATLKTFGLVVAVVLWVAAAVILGAGIVTLTCCRPGHCGKMGMGMMKGEMWEHNMPGMSGMQGMHGMPGGPGMAGMNCVPGMQAPAAEPPVAPTKGDKKK